MQTKSLKQKWGGGSKSVNFYFFNSLKFDCHLFQSYIFCALYMQCGVESQALEVNRKVEAIIGSGQKGETFKTDKNWDWTVRGNFQN